MNPWLEATGIILLIILQHHLYQHRHPADCIDFQLLIYHRHRLYPLPLPATLLNPLAIQFGL
jgi:hypothetical protein